MRGVFKKVFALLLCLRLTLKAELQSFGQVQLIALAAAGADRAKRIKLNGAKPRIADVLIRGNQGEIHHAGGRRDGSVERIPRKTCWQPGGSVSDARRYVQKRDVLRQCQVKKFQEGTH